MLTAKTVYYRNRPLADPTNQPEILLAVKNAVWAAAKIMEDDNFQNRALNWLDNPNRPLAYNGECAYSFYLDVTGREAEYAVDHYLQYLRRMFAEDQPWAAEAEAQRAIKWANLCIDHALKACRTTHALDWLNRDEVTAQIKKLRKTNISVYPWQYESMFD